MPQKIIFEELSTEERTLLLSAFDYQVDKEGYIRDNCGNKIPSREMPSKYLTVENSTLIPGSLEVIDGSPTAISKFIREKVESGDSTC